MNNDNIKINYNEDKFLLFIEYNHVYYTIYNCLIFDYSVLDEIEFLLKMFYNDTSITMKYFLTENTNTEKIMIYSNELISIINNTEYELNQWLLNSSNITYNNIEKIMKYINFLYKQYYNNEDELKKENKFFIIDYKLFDKILNIINKNNKNIFYNLIDLYFLFLKYDTPKIKYSSICKLINEFYNEIDYINKKVFSLIKVEYPAIFLEIIKTDKLDYNKKIKVIDYILENNKYIHDNTGINLDYFIKLHEFIDLNLYPEIYQLLMNKMLDLNELTIKTLIDKDINIKYIEEYINYNLNKILGE